MRGFLQFDIVARSAFSMYRAMLNNEADYPDPSSFKPERYLKNGQLDPNIRDPALMAFGFGRR